MFVTHQQAKAIANSAIVFSTDETYAPLAKGLVLSVLAADSPEFALRLVDIGCSRETLDWMRAHNVEIERFDRASYTPASKSNFAPYQDAQLCRPFLPLQATATFTRRRLKPAA